MDGIAACLDQPHNTIVRDLWDELAGDFGISALLQKVPIPHFSYHVAERYDQAGVESVLRKYAALQKPFKVRGTGLAIFTGQVPVLYVPIVRTSELSHIHTALWPHLTEHAVGTSDHYHPERWLPHITLAHGDLSGANLSAVLQRWASRTFEWEITIDNISLICDVGKPAHECLVRVDFGNR